MSRFELIGWSFVHGISCSGRMKIYTERLIYIMQFTNLTKEQYKPLLSSCLPFFALQETFQIKLLQQYKPDAPEKAKEIGSEIY